MQFHSILDMPNRMGPQEGPAMGVSILSCHALADFRCPCCGCACAAQHNQSRADDFFRPWSLRHGRQAVKSYVKSLGHEAREWLLALYVDGNLQLLAVDTIARGDVGACPVPFWKLIDRAYAVKAQAFVLVHNHPSGDPTPSPSDIQVTRRLAHVSRELNVPLLDHFIVAGDELREIAEWYWDDHPYGGAR